MCSWNVIFEVYKLSGYLNQDYLFLKNNFREEVAIQDFQLLCADGICTALALYLFFLNSLQMGICYCAGSCESAIFLRSLNLRSGGYVLTDLLISVDIPD